MPTPTTDILHDPEFHALPLGDRLDILRNNDPEFSALSPKDQGSVIAAAQQKAAGVDKLGDAPPHLGAWGAAKAIGSGLADMASGPKDFWKRPINSPSSSFQGPPTADAAPQKPSMLESMGAAQHEQFQQGREFMAKPGIVNKIAGAGHYAAGAFPMIGPAAAQAGEELGDQDYGAAAVNTAALLAPEALKMLPAKVTIKNPLRDMGKLRNVNNPVEEAALASVQPNVRMTPGQRAGATGVQKVERNLVNLPGSQTAAEDFYRGQQEELTAEGRRRTQPMGSNGAGTAIPTTSPYGAGSTVVDALTKRVQALRSYADKLYDSTRQTTARNEQLTPGNPNTKWVYNEATGYEEPREYTSLKPMETPVDLAPIRSQLKPIYQELSRSLPDARKANSPAWQSLESLMQDDATHMNAMDFDRTLGAVKAISRNGESPLLSTQSQRLARQIIDAGDAQFQAALQGAGPNVVSKLKNARKAVAEYHNTSELLGDLQGAHEEPAALYSNLTVGGDRMVDTLAHLKQVAPGAMQAVGKTFLQEMMDKATREGGWSRSEGVKADWDRMGKETKQLVYGPGLTQQMDNFFLAAKRLKPAEGSATAGRLAAIAGHGVAGQALYTFLHGAATGNPVAGALQAGGMLAATHGVPAILAEIAFKKSGANALTRAITLPTGSPAFARTMQALNAMAINDSQQDHDPLGLNPHLPQAGTQ
jgi:hypothetical protein